MFLARRNTVSLAIPFAFGCVYFFWGSTYTAIKVGVHYLHPLVLGGVRFLVAGLLLLMFCHFRRMRVWLRARELSWLAVIGLLLLGGGNIGLVYGERYIASGLAALLLASVPLYVAALSMFLPRGERLQARGWIGLGLGSLGLIVLLWPGMRHHGAGGQAMGCVILLGSAFLWAVGSLLSRELKLTVNPMVAAGWQMLTAGIVSSATALVMGGWRTSHWTPGAVGSVAYLVTFGSLVGYTAFVWLLEHVPVPKVTTYAYVNPVVAVILGATFLGEHMVVTEYAGMVGIVIAVALVTSSRIRVDQSRKTARESEAQAVEV